MRFLLRQALAQQHITDVAKLHGRSLCPIDRINVNAVELMTDYTDIDRPTDVTCYVDRSGKINMYVTFKR